MINTAKATTLGQSNEESKSRILWDKLKRGLSICKARTVIGSKITKESLKIKQARQKIVERKKVFGLQFLDMMEKNASNEEMASCMDNALKDIAKLNEKVTRWGERIIRNQEKLVQKLQYGKKGNSREQSAEFAGSNRSLLEKAVLPSDGKYAPNSDHSSNKTDATNPSPIRWIEQSHGGEDGTVISEITNDQTAVMRATREHSLTDILGSWPAIVMEETASYTSEWSVDSDSDSSSADTPTERPPTSESLSESSRSTVKLEGLQLVEAASNAIQSLDTFNKTLEALRDIVKSREEMEQKLSEAIESDMISGRASF